jgi:hypothetical protein
MRAPPGDLAGDGFYLLGPGRYTVESTLYDDLGRSCKKQWRVNASLPGSQSIIRISMPAFTVRGEPGLNAADWKHPSGDARIAILLNADPFVRPARDGARGDLEFLTEGLAALVGRIPASSVGVTVFSLDQKRKILRREAFSNEGIAEVAKAIRAFPEGADRAADPADFLAGLINGELRESAPPSTVILFGGSSRVDGKFPDGVLEAPPGVRFFYLERKAGSVASGHIGGDLIHAAMESLHGKTLTVNYPEDLAKAIAAVTAR